MTGRHHLVETHLSQLGLVLDLPVVIGAENGAGGHLLAKLVFLRRIAAWVDAARIQTGMDYARANPADPANPFPGGKLRVDEFAGDELACALTMSPRTGQNELHHTISICERFPNALDALAAGLIDRGMLWMIETLTTGLSDTEARLLAQEVLDLLTDRPFTTAQMRYRLRKRVEQVRSLHDEDGEGEEEARIRSRKARTVALRETGDGNAELVAVLGAYDAATAWKIINTAAWQVKTIGDDRGIGEIRAAVVLDLILGRIPNGHDHCHPTNEPSQPSDNAHEAGDGKGDSTGDSTANSTADSGGETAGASAPNSADAHTSPEASHDEGHDEVRVDAQGPRGGKPEGKKRRPVTRPAAGACAACGCTRPTPTLRGAAGLKSIRASNLKAMVNVTIPLTEFLLRARKPDETEPATEGPGPGAEETSERQRGSLPGEISGVGTVAGWVVRDAVNDLITTPGTASRAVVYDDTTGELKGMSSPRYVPPPMLAEHVRHRDMKCRFPGCGQDAQICDADHCIPWDQGGVTAACNLGALCRKHHRLKQTLGWTVRYEDGVAYWSAPTGHVYRSWTHDWRDPHHPTAHTRTGTTEHDSPSRTQPPEPRQDPAHGRDSAPDEDSAHGQDSAHRQDSAHGQDSVRDEDSARGMDHLTGLERLQWQEHLRGEDHGYDTAPARPDRAPKEPSDVDTWLAARNIEPLDPDGPIPF